MRWQVTVLPLHANPDNQPPPLTPEQLLWGWNWDGWLVLGLVAMVGAYLWGVRRLAARGDAWPLTRTLAWCLGGAGTIAVARLSAIGTYDTVLLSVHMVQHMLLTMIAPVLMAVGAPITLLLRNLPADPRRAVVRFLHSWFPRLLMFPPLATALMIANPYLLYLTDIYEVTLRNEVAHNWLHLHLMVSGCLYFWPLLGTDPMPNRLQHPLRMVLIMITLPFHAFLGVTIMGSPTLIAEDWYLAFQRAWPPSPLADQELAGGIMWATGDLTMAVIMGVFFHRWWADSRREAIREDRRLDREERLATLAAAAEIAEPADADPEYHADRTNARRRRPSDEDDR